MSVRSTVSNKSAPLGITTMVGGPVQVYLTSPTGYTSVSYYLDKAKTPSHTSTKSPFAYPLNASNLTTGKHTLVALGKTSTGTTRKLTTHFQSKKPGKTTTSNGDSSATPTATNCSQTTVKKLVDSVSQQNIEKNAVLLTTENDKPISRHISSPHNQKKVDWVTETLKGYGVKSSQQKFESEGYNLSNPVGRIEGKNADSYHAIGAHIDSINDDDDGGVAPGADDDASGIVTNMEVMRVLKAFQPCMKTSIEFVGFNDKEENFGGSIHYVENAKGYLGGYNLDMVGYEKGQTPCISNTYNTSGDKKFADAAAAAHKKYGIDMQFKISKYSEEDIDSVSFWDENKPIGFFVECNENTEYYHNSNDTVAHLNYPQMAKTAQILVATLAELSMKGSTTATNNQ